MSLSVAGLSGGNLVATHGCIGNPCWICYPKFAPELNRKITVETMITEHDKTRLRIIKSVLTLQDLSARKKWIDLEDIEKELRCCKRTARRWVQAMRESGYVVAEKTAAELGLDDVDSEYYDVRSSRRLMYNFRKGA